MEVRVLLFGPHAALAGRENVAVVLGEDTSCRELQLRLKEAFPQLDRLLAVSRLAVNGAFAPPEHRVQAGDEIAVIGLVSGG